MGAAEVVSRPRIASGCKCDQRPHVQSKSATPPPFIVRPPPPVRRIHTCCAWHREIDCSCRSAFSYLLTTCEPVALQGAVLDLTSGDLIFHAACRTRAGRRVHASLSSHSVTPSVQFWSLGFRLWPVLGETVSPMTHVCV